MKSELQPAPWSLPAIAVAIAVSMLGQLFARLSPR